MNKCIFTLILLLSLSQSHGMTLRAKYPDQEQEREQEKGSPKGMQRFLAEKFFNDEIAREENLFNTTACICYYKNRRSSYCTQCPSISEKKITKAQEYVIIYNV